MNFKWSWQAILKKYYLKAISKVHVNFNKLQVKFYK